MKVLIQANGQKRISHSSTYVNNKKERIDNVLMRMPMYFGCTGNRSERPAGHEWTAHETSSRKGGGRGGGEPGLLSLMIIFEVRAIFSERCFFFSFFSKEGLSFCEGSHSSCSSYISARLILH